MEQRTVTVRLGQGDAAAVSVPITLRHGAQSGTLVLASNRREMAWTYDVTEAGRPGVAFMVEYAWGWAREASAQGEWADPVLILPLPGTAQGGSFPFPRRS